TPVALWRAVPSTSYKVRNAISTGCKVIEYGPIYTITSPNQDADLTQDFYCVHGEAVRNTGDGYIVTPGTPGKP
ncbi:hypothetical protein QBC32DRAFT_225393, partial [Pseudoneurospora amorphoporcata]